MYVVAERRRCAQPLQDPELAPDDELDRKTCEGRVRAPVAKHPCEQRLRRGDTVDLAAVDRAEQQKEEQREEEDEERCFLAAPEDELLVAKLVEEKPHAGSPSSTSAR